MRSCFICPMYTYQIFNFMFYQIKDINVQRRVLEYENENKVTKIIRIGRSISYFSKRFKGTGNGSDWGESIILKDCGITGFPNAP